VSRRVARPTLALRYWTEAQLRAEVRRLRIEAASLRRENDRLRARQQPFMPLAWKDNVTQFPEVQP
jgi:hypothetical protein